MGFFSKVGDVILDFFFPKKGEVISLESLSTEDLLSTLPPAEPPDGSDVVSLFDYNHPVVREMIWELKYSGNEKVARKFGELIYDVICHELAERSLLQSASWQAQRPLIIPVPASDRRRFERGWNQAELLTKAVAESDTAKLFKYLPRQLVKIQHTESQTRTGSRSERAKNIKNSMKVLHPPAVEGRCAVLVDDVLTTGATLKEAKRALKEAGAKKILCVTVAH